MWGNLIIVVLVVLALIGLARARSADTQVLRHWSHLIDGLEHSSQEFYASVEAALGDRELPNATSSLIEIPEGGFFSADRLYLRIRRGEQLVDICAAPFGRGFFVSWWLVVPPSWIRLVPLIGWVIQILSPQTYYSIDTATMFQSVVHSAVQEVIDAATTAKGIRALTEDERKPIMRDFFKR